MRRHVVQTLSLVLMWVGGIEIMASFLAKMLFEYEISVTPYFFMALLLGIVLFIVSRIV